MPMQTTMLTYSKTVLEKVSFDPRLFEKELRKAMAYLPEEDVSKLLDWCQQRYGRQYTAILDRCFANTATA
ncbi:hypothetical protein SAMN05421823_109155 [Catalinimonas alkaloidigena]|uniref:Uncharacterized protein n=1 Tax=Catalinimonas alkaloidigena TaxID=1075417 RepID=A0A1G9PEP6_9BACT|nr:hypothetical protein [Catalinimonas alkaloidigena]SDL96635.1 hypothetical protein SAMN05421823_109155 [Catalinimonas alkaloidigena]